MNNRIAACRALLYWGDFVLISSVAAVCRWRCVLRVLFGWDAIIAAVEKGADNIDSNGDAEDDEEPHRGGKRGRRADVSPR